MEEILKFLGTNLGTIIAGGWGVFSVAALKKIIAKWNLRKKRDKRLLNNNCQILVEAIIIGMRSLTGAARVNMWQYTNGKKDMSGICFENVTCTHEKTAANVTAIKQDFINRPLDFFMRKIIARISDCQDDYLLLETKNKTGDDKIAMEKYAIVKTYNFKIFKNNVWNGVVTISFDRDVCLLPEVIHEVLIEMANIRELHQKMID